MNKLIRLCILLLSMLVIISSFAACKKETSEPEVETPTVEETQEFEPQAETQEEETTTESEESSLAGTKWKLTACDVGQGEESVSSDESYTFNEDDTLILKTADGSVYEGTYNLEGDKGTASVSVDEEKANFGLSVEGDKLTMKIVSGEGSLKYYYTKQ